MSNVRVVKDNWREASIRLDDNIEQAVSKVALAVEAQIVSNITTAGLVDTGNYRRSWTTDIRGPEAEVGSPVEYGPYLEYGTRFMAARAHIVPAAKSVAARITSYFRDLER